MVDPGIAAIVGALITTLGTVIVAIIQSKNSKQPDENDKLLLPPNVVTYRVRKYSRWYVVMAIVGGLLGYGFGALRNLETKSSIKGFSDGCIDSQLWTPYVGEEHNKDINGCWQLADWGYSAQDSELHLSPDEKQEYQWHGILTRLPQNADIKFEIRVDQLKTTTQSENAQITLGIVDFTRINTDSDKYLFYHVTDTDLVISISFGEWELQNASKKQDYVKNTNQQVLFSIKGTALDIYIDGVKVVESMEIAFSQQAFWIGYNLPPSSNLQAYISNLEITEK